MSGADILELVAGGVVVGFALGCLRHIALPRRTQNALRGPLRLDDTERSGPRRGDIDASTEGEELGRTAPPRKPKGGT
jgi:hypothetical protein